MHKNKGFTLIEVMVVLSILALVAILAYNFFGSTMKEAKLKSNVTQLKKDMQAISTAWGLYYAKNGAHPGSVDALVTDGQLKAAPVPPNDTVVTPPGGYGVRDDYDCMGSVAMQDPNPCVKDDLVRVYYVKKEICEAVNAEYNPDWAGLYPTWEYDMSNGEPAKYPTSGHFFCTGKGDPNYALWLIHDVY